MRDRLWTHCCKHWPWPVVEGQHAEGTFNRGAAINNGARGEWDIIVILDADVIAPVEQIDQAIKTALETGHMTLAFDHYVNVSEEATERVLSGSAEWPAESDALYTMDHHLSSIIAVPRPLWDRVGGFDERFAGYSFNDVQFALACQTLGGGMERVPGTVWHLYHPDDFSAGYRDEALRLSCGLLVDRYWQAAGDPVAMQALVDEWKELDELNV